MPPLDLASLSLPLLLQLSWSTDDRDEVVLVGRLRAVDGARLTVRLQPSVVAPARGRAGATLQLQLDTDDGSYSAPATLVDYDPATQELQVTLAAPFQSVQRRRFARARVSLGGLTAALVAAPGPEAGSVTLDLIDLSGGGLRAVADRPLQPHDRLQLRLPLEGGPPIEAILTVLDCRRRRADVAPPAAAGPAMAAAPDHLLVDARRLPPHLRAAIEPYRAPGQPPAAPDDPARRGSRRITRHIVAIDTTRAPAWLVAALTSLPGATASETGAPRQDYLVRCRFDRLSPKDRQRIIEFVAQRQATDQGHAGE
jgi:hypothetical protein